MASTPSSPPQRITLRLDDVVYETSPSPRFLRRKPFQRIDPTQVRAVLPGMVQAIQVAAGQMVKRGQPLATVEAMKMQNSVLAPRDGIIRAVHVGAGEKVAKGRVLMEYEDA